MTKCSVLQDAYSTSTHCLPHTGLDLWPIVLVAIVLLVVGGVLWRMSLPKKRSGWPPVQPPW